MLCSTLQFNDFPMHCTSMHFISYHLDKEVTYIFNLFLFSISFICQQRPRSLALPLTHRLLHKLNGVRWTFTVTLRCVKYVRNPLELVILFSPWHVAVPTLITDVGTERLVHKSYWDPVPAYLDTFETADVSLRIHLPSTRLVSPANESAKTLIHSPKWNAWMRHESDIVWKPNLLESSKCDDVPKLVPVFSVSIQHGRQNNSLDFLSDTEMPASGDLKSGDIPVSNYTPTSPPQEKGDETSSPSNPPPCP